jgi:hydrogenase maturation protease
VVATVTPCRALVAGYGVPGQRDLDFGRQVIRYLEPFRWPQGVIIEDLSYSAHLVLHRIQELRPRKLVVVAAVARGTDPPGTVRRPSVDRTSPSAETVHQALAQSVGGAVDFDHTLAVLRHWGGLPPETVLVEVEPADDSFGPGFSDELGPCLDRVLAIVQDELGSERPELVLDDGERAPAAAASPPVSADMDPLLDFVRQRDEARQTERRRGRALVAPVPAGVHGVEVATRTLAWGIGLESGSDWYDVIPLDGGAVGVVLGDVPGRGAAGAPLRADLRAAVQAYAVLEGDSPERVVACVDRLVSATGQGEGTALTYVTMQPDTGEVRICSAGGCPPLVVNRDEAEFLQDSFTAPLGGSQAVSRREVTARLVPGSTLLLYTDGLVATATRPLALGLLELQEAAARGPCALDALCEHVVEACVNRKRRDDDVSVVALRIPPA